MNNEEKILSAIEGLTSTVNAQASTLNALDSKVNALVSTVNTLDSKVNSLTSTVDTLVTDVDALKQGQQEIQQTVTRIEIEHGKKLDALFDGFKTNLDMHEAIEPRIAKLERTAEKHTVEMLAFRHAK